MTALFQQWISGEECLPILQLCAKQVIRRANSLALQLDDTYEDAEEYQQTVTSLLWQYLMEHGAPLAERGTALLVIGDDGAFIAYLSQAFISHCLDMRRTDSPFHAYYRHMRAVISHQEGFRYEPRGTEGSYYACSDADDLSLLPKRFQHEDYDKWCPPSVPFSDIHEKPAMVQLATFFWDESLRWVLVEFLLPIRELVRYVTFSYPLITTVVSQGEGEAAAGNDAPGGMEHRMPKAVVEEAWLRQSRLLELDVVDAQLETLARDCVAELSVRQARSLYLYDQDFTLEEIARQLGEKGASNVHYHLKGARSVLKRRWSLWGPPTLKHFSEVDEEEFYLFYEKVISFCKKGAEGRS